MMNQNQSFQPGGQQATPSPFEIWRAANDPMLRLQDVPGGMLLAGQLMLNPDDPALLELFQLVQRDQIGQAMVSGDPFWPNFPPTGNLQPPGPGRVPLATLPTGDVLSLPISPFCNVLLVGATRFGKTNILRLMIASLLQAGAIVVAFDPKEELADCELLCHAGLPVLVMDWHELKLAFLQPPPSMSVDRFINVKVEQVLGVNMKLQASQRLAIETLRQVFTSHRAKEVWPLLTKWIDLLLSVKANSAGRRGQYRDAVVACLKQITDCGLGGVFNHTRSDLLDRMFSGPSRAYIIRTGGLMSDMAAVLACEFISYVYELRGTQDLEQPRPIVFVLDDAVSLLKGGLRAESEGQAINPIGQWSLLGNGRGIYFIGAVQLFRWTSGSFVHNCHTVMCVGADGDDAQAIASHLGLTREQATQLQMLRPGELIVRAKTEYPLAVYGKHPLAH